MEVFRRSVTLTACVEDIFAFHANPLNLTAISPKWQSAQVLYGGDPARQGGDFAIRVHFFGLIPMVWIGRWREVMAPTLLMDEASFRLLRTWEHRHHFRALGPNRTEMTDVVTYALPFGWLGRWLEQTVIKSVLLGMFKDRHERTRAYFEGRAL